VYNDQIGIVDNFLPNLGFRSQEKRRAKPSLGTAMLKLAGSTRSLWKGEGEPQRSGMKPPPQPPGSRKPERHARNGESAAGTGRGLYGTAKPPRKEYRWDPIRGELNPL